MEKQTIKYMPGQSIKSPITALDAIKQGVVLAQKKGIFELQDAAILHESILVLEDFFDKLINGNSNIHQSSGITTQEAVELHPNQFDTTESIYS